MGAKTDTRTLRGQRAGFTVVELMISSAVFAAVLLVVTVAVLQIGRTYYKGITITRNQETTRAVIDEISQAIQFGGEPVFVPGMICAGSKRFSYVLNQPVTSSTRALMLAEVSSCAGQTQNMTVGRELLGARMRLAVLDVYELPDPDPDSDSQLYRITVRVATGDNSLLEDNLDAAGNPGSDGVLDTCRPVRSGGQFCAASELSTVVQRRL